jgi:2-polyprenyl-3-methyl-5-hydroxy-6-metoxy-1,4-benzoquinol methylase
MRLNLGSGLEKIDGFLGVDKCHGADIEMDLERDMWIWYDDSIDEIICKHFVEHIHDLSGFMNNCHRILIPGGRMTIVTPHPLCDFFWQDPTHIRGYTANTFTLYCTGYPGTIHAGIIPWNSADVAEAIYEINGVRARIITATMTK